MARKFLEAEMGTLLTAPWGSGEAEAVAGSCLSVCEEPGVKPRVRCWNFGCQGCHVDT